MAKPDVSMPLGSMVKAAEGPMMKSGHGGDRRSQDFHMDRAKHHIQQAVERRLSEKDKGRAE